jgi:hypothetical protein
MAIALCFSFAIIYGLSEKINRIDNEQVVILQDISAIENKLKSNVETPVITQPVVQPTSEIPKPTNQIQVTHTNISESYETSEYDYEALKQVAKNLNIEWLSDTPEQAEIVIGEFNKLDEIGKIINGFWWENTPEYKLRELLLQGKGLKEAKLIIDPNGDYWAENKPSEVTE